MMSRIINNIHRSSIFYNLNGYVVLKNTLNDDIKNKLTRYVNEIENHKKCNNYINQYEMNSNREKVLCRTEYIINNHMGMNGIITNGFIPELVSKIYNKPIKLYKEKINYKYPGTGGYRAHQDITAYPDSKNHITCMINLCDTNYKNGCLSFSPLSTQNILLPNKNGIIKNPDRLRWIDCPTNFGDIVLFNSYIPHKSNPNITNRPYVLMTLRSTDLCFLCVITETNEVGIIIEKEVPTAKCIKYAWFTFKVSKIKNKKGTVIRPPPIPNNPAKKPTGNAVRTIKIIKYEYSFENIKLINLTCLMYIRS